MDKRSRYTAMIVAFVLILAACSSGDGGSILEQSSGSTADSDEPNPFDDVPSTVGDLPGVSGECEALLNLFLSIGGAFLGAEISSLDSATLANLPSEIRDDAQLVSETLAQFRDGLQALGIDLADPSSVATLTPAQQQQLGELTDSLDTEQFNAATENLNTYEEQQCEVVG